MTTLSVLAVSWGDGCLGGVEIVNVGVLTCDDQSSTVLATTKAVF